MAGSPTPAPAGRGDRCPSSPTRWSLCTPFSQIHLVNQGRGPSNLGHRLTAVPGQNGSLACPCLLSPGPWDASSALEQPIPPLRPPHPTMAGHLALQPTFLPHLAAGAAEPPEHLGKECPKSMTLLVDQCWWLGRHAGRHAAPPHSRREGRWLHVSKP